METEGFDRIASQIPRLGALLLGLPDKVKNETFDIHLKASQPITLGGRNGVMFLTASGNVTCLPVKELPVITKDELQTIFTRACDHSVFTHEHEIRRGYITTAFSARAGICGTAVMEKGAIKALRDITSIVFRIPRDVRGCADRLFTSGAELSKGVLLAGEPSSGKTTFLRDVICSLSFGKFAPPARVAVLDERGELGGEFDLGPCADVLSGCPKAEAFDIAIRMLSPQFIVCDELSSADLETVERSVYAGVSLIATVHSTRNDIDRRPLCRRLLSTGAFGTLVCLAGRFAAGKIESMERVCEAYEASGYDFDNVERTEHRPVPRSRIA